MAQTKKTAVVKNQTPANVVQAEIPQPKAEIQDPQNILESKAYVAGMGVTYKTPKEMLSPILKLFSYVTGQVIVYGSNEVTNANEDATKNTSFARVAAIAKFNIDERHHYEIGFLYAIDMKKPMIKIYRGQRVAACLNLNVYGSDDVKTFDFNSFNDIDTVREFITGHADRIKRIIEYVEKLKHVMIPAEIVPNIIGKMICETLKEDTENGTNSVIDAAKNLFNPESQYFVEQKNFNAWQLYNAFTHYFGGIKNKTNFFDVPEKSKAVLQHLRKIEFFN